MEYLRNRCSYLAPTGSDKLLLVCRIVLGLLFNLLFLSLALIGAALLLGEFVYRPSLPGLHGSCADGCSADLPIGFWAVPVGLAGAGILLALLSMIRRPKTDAGNRLLETWSKRGLLWGLALAVPLVLLPVLVDVAHSISAARAASGTPKVAPGAGAVGGLTLLILGVLAQLRQAFASPAGIAKTAGAARKALAGLSSKLRLALAYAAGALIGPLLLLAVTVFALSIALAKTGDGVNWTIVAIGVGAIGMFLLLYLVADITAVSLHRFYKRRLSTAFSLKRVKASRLSEAELGRIQAIVEPAVDPAVALERDFDHLVPLSETALRDSDRWPTLLVCAAANISDVGATPPGRHVTSFTFSADAIGGPLVGAAPTELYGRVFDRTEDEPTAADSAKNHSKRMRDLSLPAAVAMSGAAISPSMGKMTRRPLTFLLALANLRLGVWVPNPRWVMGDAKDQLWRHGRPRASYLLRELVGLNRVDANYLYVTDGGHYENLGLVELLRRGCTEIYCFDASGGESFTELGDAIALARSELDVEVEIDPTDLRPTDASSGADASSDNDASAKATALAKANAVRGSFTYRTGPSQGVSGKLVYARNVLTQDAPWDVKALHEVHPTFPHDPTADQLFTDQKFEGYRALGEVAGRKSRALMRE